MALKGFECVALAQGKTYSSPKNDVGEFVVVANAAFCAVMSVCNMLKPLTVGGHFLDTAARRVARFLHAERPSADPDPENRLYTL